MNLNPGEIAEILKGLRALRAQRARQEYNKPDVSDTVKRTRAFTNQFHNDLVSKLSKAL